MSKQTTLYKVVWAGATPRIIQMHGRQTEENFLPADEDKRYIGWHSRMALAALEYNQMAYSEREALNLSLAFYRNEAARLENALIGARSKVVALEKLQQELRG